MNIASREATHPSRRVIQCTLEVAAREFKSATGLPIEAASAADLGKLVGRNPVTFDVPLNDDRVVTVKLDPCPGRNHQSELALVGPDGKSFVYPFGWHLGSLRRAAEALEQSLGVRPLATQASSSTVDYLVASICAKAGILQDQALKDFAGSSIDLASIDEETKREIWREVGISRFFISLRPNDPGAGQLKVRVSLYIDQERPSVLCLTPFGQNLEDERVEPISGFETFIYFFGSLTTAVEKLHQRLLKFAAPKPAAPPRILPRNRGFAQPVASA